MTQANNPLHGIKLETIVTELVEKYGWEELASRINIKCFKENPSVKSSLTFLRKTPWARDKVEYLYLKANKLPLPPPKVDSRNPATKTHNAAKKPQSIKKPTAEATDAPSKPVNADIWGNG
ncbi:MULTISPECIES: VF530 family DNA-binding protein [Shewanella]|uniref:VF530 family protein n=1 Tax=Shewanella metallivivens TaxID=2872342 RepID=A0ABT5TGK0_9GAMM|nr:VF530 family protein [Shewanella metallivivens]MDD8057747.1 VF530 family protein [Shewanella metallivivens]